VLGIEGTVSVRAESLRLTWVDRDLFGSRFTSETTAFVERREEPSFEFVRQGLGFFVRRTWEEWSSSFGYEFRPTDVTDDSFSGQDLDDDSEVGALSASLSLDDRDNLLLPTRGRHARARADWADDGFGSDTEFLRGQLDYTHLFRLSDEGVLAASARTGVMAPFGETVEIPLPERFFNGGENSVRSFREDELLPPRDSFATPPQSNDPTGGEAATTLNLEYRRLLTGNLAAAVFVDTGNVTLDYHDYLRFEGFRTGVGVGLRYLLPIGPVRLDLALNPDPEEDDPATLDVDEEEDDLVLHFSVGFPF
jgi:outer membrane protein assembly factor BamA